MIKIILMTLSVTLIFCKENYSQLYRITNQNNEPIPFVTVYDPETETGDLTDDSGIFRSEPGKTIILSSLGYLQDTVILKNSPHTSLIILKQDISNSYTKKDNFKIIENKSFEAGNLENRKQEYFYLASDDLSLITKIDNPIKKTAQLTEAKFNLKIDNSYTLRIRVLSVHPKTGKPERDLLKENVIINELNLVGNYQIDLSTYGIPIPPEGIYIGFDILPVGQMEDLKIKVGLLPYSGKSESYIGAILLNKWTLFNSRLKYEEPKGNFMFGIKAIY